MVLQSAPQGRDTAGGEAYLVRKGERELDLVRGDIGVTPSRKRSGEGGRANSESCTSDTERVHDCGGGWNSRLQQCRPRRLNAAPLDNASQLPQLPAGACRVRPGMQGLASDHDIHL